MNTPEPNEPVTEPPTEQTVCSRCGGTRWAWKDEDLLQCLGCDLVICVGDEE